jgi:sigma-B regulation protein RsbU (phosphoserine phosphatase)
MLGVVPLDETHVGLYILDVNGSGVPSSLLATHVSRCLGSAVDPASILVDHESGSLVEPEDVARKLNEQFSGNPEVNQYFTITYGILNRETFEFRYTCAGHPPSLLQSGGGAPGQLEGFGLPIGVSADSDDFHQETVVLKGGDRLFLYSNGLVNTPNAGDELFGRNRLMKVIEDQQRMPIHDLPGKVLSEVRDFGNHAELSDDVTLLAIEIE